MAKTNPLPSGVLSILVLVTLFYAPAWSQGPMTAIKAKAKIVGFRALEWKTVRLDSEDQAQQTIATLKKLGCETSSSSNQDHFEIRFRCENWRSMKLDTDSLANQWVAWCGAQGLETVMVNPPAKTKKPTVQFRMATAKTVHLHDLEKAKKIINTLTLVGCKVDTQDHNGHLDTTFSATEWITLALESQDSAESWHTWLKESGFETKRTLVTE